MTRGPGGPGGSNTNRDRIIAFLRGKGLNDAAIAGILGNMMEESSLDPTAWNPNESARGLIQWEGGRLTALRNYAQRHGGSETDLDIQLGFLWHELSTSYSGVLQQLQHATDPAEAAALVDAQYEVSAGTTREARVDFARQFYGGGGPTGGHSSNTAPAGAGGGLGGGGGGMSERLTKDDLLGVDSLGSLLDSVPELSKIVDKALKQNWSVDKFQNEVEDSHWYKSHSSTARSILIQQANDPASYRQNLSNTLSSLRTLSHQLGMSLGDNVLKSIANNALLTGNDGNQQWLTQQIGRHEDYSKLGSLDGLSGGMANTAQQLQQLAADYGHTWSPSQLARYSQQILMGNQTIDTYKQQLVSWAKSAFPSLSKELDSGSTVKDLADPYVQSMSQLLEVDPSTLNTYTPLIRKALQGQRTKPDADPTAIPLWQFEDQVRQDPRWQYTQNAHDTISSALVKIGSDFGFGL